VICWRVVAPDPAARPHERGGLLWFPREFQGEGRHDNPDLYGCLYAAAEPESAVAESLAAFRGSGPLHSSMFLRAGKLLHLGKLVLADRALILDLDDPQVLVQEGLRPSRVATRQRSMTQTYAARLYRSHSNLSALRWWSTLESTLTNVTVFDRAQKLLALEESRPLSLDMPEVVAAAELLGLA
jgi:hypothetical protein